MDEQIPKKSKLSLVMTLVVLVVLLCSGGAWLYFRPEPPQTAQEKSELDRLSQATIDFLCYKLEKPATINTSMELKSTLERDPEELKVESTIIAQYGFKNAEELEILTKKYAARDDFLNQTFLSTKYQKCLSDNRARQLEELRK